jgi:hypothetical protein
MPPAATDNSTSARNYTHSASEHSGTRVPTNARIPIADNRRDRIAFQRLRNDDVSRRGTSVYDDQGIVFEGDQPIDLMEQVYLRSRGQNPLPNNPYCGNGGISEGNRDPPFYPGQDRSPYDNPGGGGGSDGRDEDLPPNRRHNFHRGYSMPLVVRDIRGVRAAMEHHRDEMHDQLIRLCREHLSVRLPIPEGCKIRRFDQSSVGKYNGSPEFSDLEGWVMNLVIMLEVIRYGGDDCDEARLLCIPEFLTGEAKKWFFRYIIHPNRSQTHWTFEQAITGLYDRFIHATMEEARDIFAIGSSYSPHTKYVIA